MTERTAQVTVAEAARGPRGLPGDPGAPGAPGTPGGPKGDPGANVMAIGLFVIASTLLIPGGTDLVRTSGYGTPGNGTAEFIADDTVDAAYVASHPTGSSFISSNARGFRLSTEQDLTPEMVGAKGDTVTDASGNYISGTDDYAALQRLTALLNSTNGQRVTFGARKTYYVGQHRTSTNGVTQLTITDANGLTVHGNGAKILFDGNFNRAVGTTAGIGLKLIGCKNPHFWNLELDGDVRQTTKAGGIVESGFSYGLAMYGVLGGSFIDCDVHHFATDGLLTAQDSRVSPSIGSKQLNFFGCKFRNNARQAYTADVCEHINFYNCRFTDTQRTGAYGGHAPGSGFDAEPTQSLNAGTADVNCNNIHFWDCVSDNNAGSDCTAVLGSVSDLSWNKCKITAPNDAGAASTIFVTVDRVTWRDCNIDMKGHRFEFGGEHFLLEHSRVLSTCAHQICIYNVNHAGSHQRLKNNRFINNGIATDVDATFNWRMIDLEIFNIVFEDNYVYIPGTQYLTGGFYPASDRVQLSGIKRAVRNKYETDLTDGGTGRFYSVSYGTTVTTALDEEFVGTVPGTADTFRPGSASTFDTHFLHTRNKPGFRGAPGKLALANANYTFQHSRDAMHLELAVNLSAARTLTLDDTLATEGAEVIVTRLAAATGSSLDIKTTGGTLIKSLATGADQYAQFRRSAGVWTRVGAGLL